MAVIFGLTVTNLNHMMLSSQLQTTIIQTSQKDLDLFFYDTITIQSAQTNSSFYQLNLYVLLQGVATISNQIDSLNNVSVTLLLGKNIYELFKEKYHSL